MKFDRVGDFAATYDAEAWLKNHGYSFGPMQRGSPRGIMKGDVDIGKWRNLSIEEINQLDGSITGDGRNGPIFVSTKS